MSTGLCRVGNFPAGYIVMACLIMAYTGMAYIVMACTVMAYIGMIVMAYIGMAYIVMAYIGIAYIGMACIVITYIGMAYIVIGLFSYGPYHVFVIERVGGVRQRLVIGVGLLCAATRRP